METAYLMDEMRNEVTHPDVPKGLGSPGMAIPQPGPPDAMLARIEERLGPVVHKLEKIEENGQIDFRKLTGAEAMAVIKGLSGALDGDVNFRGPVQ